MAARAQEICVALGAPELTAVDGARNIMRESKAYRSPGALDTVYQDAVKFSKYCKTAWSIDYCLVQFDPLRQVAESRLGEGSAFPDTFAAIVLIAGA